MDMAAVCSPALLSHCLQLLQPIHLQRFIWGRFQCSQMVNLRQLAKCCLGFKTQQINIREKKPVEESLHSESEEQLAQRQHAALSCTCFRSDE